MGFLATKKAKDEERIGRQSGSMAWRLIRGETGITTKNSVSTEVGTIISLQVVCLFLSIIFVSFECFNADAV